MKSWNVSGLELKPRLPEIISSSEDARAIVLDLGAGESLDEHEVHERAFLVVLSGEVEVGTGAGTSAAGGAGLLVEFEPRERHRVDARSDARLLLDSHPLAGRRAPRRDGDPREALHPPPRRQATGVRATPQGSSTRSRVATDAGWASSPACVPTPPTRSSPALCRSWSGWSIARIRRERAGIGRGHRPPLLRSLNPQPCGVGRLRSRATACGRASAIASPVCATLRGLPGKLTIRVKPRMPATARESIQWRV